MDAVLGRFSDWLKKPYDDDMSVVGWFLFFGMLVVIMTAWSGVIRRMVD
jgi:hypothetical protein